MPIINTNSMANVPIGMQNATLTGLGINPTGGGFNFGNLINGLSAGSGGGLGGTIGAGLGTLIGGPGGTGIGAAIGSFLQNIFGGSTKYDNTEWQGWDAQDGWDAKGNSVVWHIQNVKPDEANDPKEQEHKIKMIVTYINNVGVEESFRRFKALYSLPPSRGASLLKSSDFIARFTPYGFGDIAKQLAAAWDFYLKNGRLPQGGNTNSQEEPTAPQEPQVGLVNNLSAGNAKDDDKKSKTQWGVIALVAVIVVAAGIAAYSFFNNKNNA